MGSRSSFVLPDAERKAREGSEAPSEPTGLRRPEEAEKTHIRRSDGAFETPDQTGAAGHVLLVDDHAELRRVWARALRRLGHEITEATSGTEALARLGEQRFDFVLSDVQMPDMTGLELLENVRTLDPDLAFALLTGAPDASSIARAMELGVFEYLTKPVDLAKLTASVGRGVLRTQKRRERAPQSG